MHTGYYFGFFLAAVANYFIGSRFGWRAMFLVGGTPAILIAAGSGTGSTNPLAGKIGCNNLVRKWTMPRAFLALFAPRYRRRTIFNSIYLVGFSDRAVGWIGLRSVGSYLSGAPNRPQRSGFRQARFVFDSVAWHCYGSYRARHSVRGRSTGPQSHAGDTVRNYVHFHLGGFSAMSFT